MLQKPVLVLFTAKSSGSLKKLLRLAAELGPGAWFVLDGKTMELLARSGAQKALPADRVFVFSGRRSEEFALRVFSLVKPASAYVCDENRVLEPITRFLLVAGIYVEEC
ncbi:MAG: hypothetical protein ACP5KA_03825 [Desulfurococcaceae archaeon]